MRVAILTSGRFHVCDLARELDALGHDVAFYSYVPKWRSRRFGLPDRCNRCLLGWLAPWVAGARVLRDTRWQHAADRALVGALDRLAAWTVGPCDVFIGMSGMSTLAARTVRRRYGAQIWIERGSRHILSQQEILENLPGATPSAKLVPDHALRRELADYALADTIVVPSLHVEQSFLERGTDASRLVRNPYGVALDMFPPTPAPPCRPPTVLMVGAWSLRKGCDVLYEAWKRLPGVRLLHVGPVQDALLPTEPGFEHHPAVDQVRLTDYYGQAHVLALASREEGLSLVLAQALASGLHVVCSERTGGEDLQAFLDDPTLVQVVPVHDPVALATALDEALQQACSARGMRDFLGSSRQKLSWRAYGKRYDRFLKERA